MIFNAFPTYPSMQLGPVSTLSSINVTCLDNLTFTIFPIILRLLEKMYSVYFPSCVLEVCLFPVQALLPPYLGPVYILLHCSSWRLHLFHSRSSLYVVLRIEIFSLDCRLPFDLTYGAFRYSSRFDLVWNGLQKKKFLNFLKIFDPGHKGNEMTCGLGSKTSSGYRVVERATGAGNPKWSLEMSQQAL